MASPTLQVLRYPYEALTETTDYLQIDILSYTKAGLTESGGSRANRQVTFLEKTLAKNLGQNTLSSGGTIFLPMPSNIQDGNSVTYNDDTLNSIVGAAVAGTQGAMGIDFGNLPSSMADVKNTVEDAITKSGLDMNRAGELVRKYLAGQAVNIFGANVTVDQILAREEGQIFNPNMELLFNGVTLRSFKFSFKMTPRDDKESEQVGLIIRSLKQNMAPRSGTSGAFLSTPNVFGLTYKQGRNEHPFLHKFKQCALTDISVNYTGENVYATYGDGTPISMIMDLTFKELEPIYAKDYDPVLDSNGNIVRSGAGGVGY